MEASKFWRNFWLALTMVALCLLLFLQIVWFVGTTTLKEYQALQKESLQITDEISRVQAAAGERETGALLAPLNKKMDLIGPQLDSASMGLKSFNNFWLFRFRTGSHDKSDPSSHADVRVANSTTQVLGLYILPLLYGVLGALVSIVQLMRGDDSDEAIRKHRPGVRVVTGAVAGPMIGMFISPEFLNSLAFQATPFLIAFLGGYATEVFFALIDRFLSSLRNNVSNRAPEAANSEVARGAAAHQGNDAGPQNGVAPTNAAPGASRTS